MAGKYKAGAILGKRELLAGFPLVLCSPAPFPTTSLRKRRCAQPQHREPRASAPCGRVRNAVESLSARGQEAARGTLTKRNNPCPSAAV